MQESQINIIRASDSVSFCRLRDSFQERNYFEIKNCSSDFAGKHLHRRLRFRRTMVQMEKQVRRHDPVRADFSRRNLVCFSGAFYGIAMQEAG
jgi:hypothetical protein